MPETKMMKGIEMTVMRVENLPETFRPPSSSTEATGALPGPLADLIQEATSGLTAAERRAFLDRRHAENPEVFYEEPDDSGDPGDSRGLSKEEWSKEEWRGKLTRWLKEEANRFMAAAAVL
jgi:hypothetical protein